MSSGIENGFDYYPENILTAMYSRSIDEKVKYIRKRGKKSRFIYLIVNNSPQLSTPTIEIELREREFAGILPSMHMSLISVSAFSPFKV